MNTDRAVWVGSQKHTEQKKTDIYHMITFI